MKSIWKCKGARTAQGLRELSGRCLECFSIMHDALESIINFAGKPIEETDGSFHSGEAEAGRFKL